MPISTEKASRQRSKLIEVYDYMYAGWSNYLDQAQMDMEFYLDVQNTKDEADKANEVGRTLYVFNKIKRQVRMLHGYEQRNRHILKIQPVGLEDEGAADQHTGIIMQQMAAGGYDMMSEAFKWGPLITGANLIEPFRDRKGNIRFGRLGYNQFMVDPAVSQMDWSDAEFYMTGRYLSTATAKSLIPTAGDKIDSMRPEGSSSTRWTQGTQYPYRIRGKIRLYEELWEKSTKFVEMIAHENGRMVPFKQVSDQVGKETANKMIAELRDPSGKPLLTKFKEATNEITLTIYVDSEPVWSGPNPLGIDEYNPVWMVGEYVPENDRSESKLQPFSRTLRDPQRARNRRLNQMIDIVESQISNVRLVRKNAIVNKKAAYRTGQGGPIFIEDDFKGPLADAMVQLPAPSIPAGMFQLLEVLEREETDSGGLNESVFGTDEGQNKAIPMGLHKLRTGQGLIGQQGYFANFRSAKQQLGKKLVKINQATLPSKRLTRMLQEQEDPAFRDPNFSDYDCVPTEGLLTDTQRELNYEQLNSLRQTFPDAQGVISLKMMIENSTVMNKKELIEAVGKAEEAIQQQNQEQAKQAERSQQQLDTIAMSEAITAKARAAEDISDSHLNRVQTLEKIQEIRQKASRDDITTLVEIGQSLGLLPNPQQERQAAG